MPRAKGQLVEGFKYVVSTPVLGSTLLMMAIIGTLTYEFQVTLPIVAVLGTGPATSWFENSIVAFVEKKAQGPGNYALETGGNLASLVTNTTGLATASGQATAASSLSTIATNTTGAATAANQTNATANHS